MCTNDDTICSKPNGQEPISSDSATADDTPSASLLDYLCCSKPVSSARELGVWDKSLEDQANCLSNWTFSYLNPLLRLGSTKVLDAHDIGVPSTADRADNAYTVALEAWKDQSKKVHAYNETIKAKHQAQLDACTTDEERQKVKLPQLKDPSIASALCLGYGRWTLAIGLVYYVLGALLSFVPVLILNNLVAYFESGRDTDEFNGWRNPWIQVAGLVVVPLLVSLLQTKHLAIFNHAAVFVRTAVSTLLYRKALQVSAAGRAQTSTGQVVNMMSNDTAQLQRFLQFAGFTMTAPLQIVIALILIYRQVGNATWVGVGFMIFLAPVNMVVFSIVSKQRREVLKYSDLRVKMMNEILSGIRIIKFYAWERPFGKEVGELRGKELAALTKLAYTAAIGFSLILMAAPLIQPVLVFLTYTAIQDTPLNAATAFTTVALFNMMRFPFAFLPMGLLQYIQSKISLSRLERYLDLPELSEYVVDEQQSTQGETCIGSVSMKNASFSWVDPDAKPVRPIQVEKKSARKRGNGAAADLGSSQHSSGASVDTEATSTPTITLQDLSCEVASGSLVAVVGSVGSGKSSFLSAILGEMEPINGGQVFITKPADAKPGFVSYCSQTPWVVNDTLRGNILFGRQFKEERYNSVLEACALVDDLAVLPAGDLTEIGERGINLSGGQKARVSLARALYDAETRLILMDDPLSAVDSHVGEHIFSQAICGDVSNGCTRILVTHHVHLLSRCDQVIVLEKGRIQHCGRYDELVASGVDFAGALDVEVKENSKAAKERTTASGTPDAEDSKMEADASSQEQMAKNGKTLVKEEEKEEGAVAGSAYHHYAKAGGYCVAIMICVIQGLGRAAEIGSGFWLAFWAKESVRAENRGEPHDSADTNYFIAMYALFGFLGILGLTGRSILIALHRLRASRKLHDGLAESMLRAPISFFDVTPTGRILNRFAADMDKVDLELTQSLSQGISTLFNVFGAIAAIIAATEGTVLVPLVPMGFAYYLIQKWFRKTSTELQRINSVANSPIFSDFSQILSGTSTIRAYGEEGRFFTQCKTSFDTMNASFMLIQLASSWLSLRLDVLGGFMGAFIGGVAVATNSINPGWVGLALSYSIEVSNFLKHGVKMIATIEAQMNSVERILFYTEQVQPEPPEYIQDKDPDPSEWPSNGTIEFENASMRYRDGPLVLKNISVSIRGGEKIGVCGRTGSGKSSLMIALFRISETESEADGRILIDGVNIREIGTAALRMSLSIIPQDPIIFSNTVRYNLDPFGKASDTELWEVLDKVQMTDAITELPNGLEEQVAEGGENFSQGQRQLLCIARALLRKPRILVMDEATASIDNTTDAGIQDMIRENFGDATVLTIAHRLNTIMDSDRVLVLDDGVVAEFDTPEVLLQKENGLFKEMVAKSKAAQASTN